MEGVRQRHCVAAYDALIRVGVCAIASVFVEHQRWTVELRKSANPARPLRVVQVKSRFNGNPSSRVRAEIRAMFGEGSAVATAAEQDPQTRYHENFRRVLPACSETTSRPV